MRFPHHQVTHSAHLPGNRATPDPTHRTIPDYMSFNARYVLLLATAARRSRAVASM